ncbi:MAG: DUF262 domain-containing protein, partial [Helicobacter sp.]|nr:DUF262 domain-containing protein [Helicobacter sp.]
MLSGTKNSRKKPYFKEFLDKLLQSPKETLVDKMQEIIDNTNLSSKQWWEQLLIRQQELFAFLNEKKGPFYKCRRIRYFNKKSRRIIDSIKNVSKVDLLPDRSNKKNVRDLLDYGLYCYCKEKTLDVSEYENDEEQYGDIEKPHFALNGKPILCDSSKTKIIYDSQEYPINLEKINVFDEFERILKEIKKA